MKVATSTWRRGVGLVGFAAAMFAGGCATTGPGFKGVVEQGPASVLVVVDETDKRAKEPGIAGVKITAEARPNNAPAKILGTATSDAAGKFALALPDNKPLKEQVWITAEKPGYKTLKAPVYLQSEGRVLIVVLSGGGK